MKPMDFRNDVMGKRFDIDGYYGSQCWDAYAYYMQKLGYKYANCTSTGYVKDIWNNRATNGMLESCFEVDLMQQGDIAVFGNTSETPYSHVAIFMLDNGNGTGVFLSQNQGGANGAFNEISFSYINILGSFRPNCFKDLFPKCEDAPASNELNCIPGDFRYENAKFTVTADTPIRIRKAPSTSGADTGYTYEKGMSVIYDGYVVREGYVWISWISNNDATRRWMACGRANAQGKNIEPWGTFK